MRRYTRTKLAMTLAAAALMMSVRFGASAQQSPIVPFDLNAAKANLRGLNGQELSYLDKNGTATGPTAPCLETLRGNGTRAGYMLTHGGVIPASVRVSVGARSLRSGVDYGLDYSTGMLVFTEPVRRFDTITISYDYVTGADGSRSLAPASGMTLNFRGTSLNFGYGVSAFNGLDFNSYGLSTSSQFGSGSTLKGFMYFSTPSASNDNVQGRTDATRAGNLKRDLSKAKSGHLLTQELNAKVGSASVRATYQDVGTSFGGFQAMRQSNAGNAEALNQIAILEKERGIRRLGFGTSLPLSGTTKLGFDWDRTSDGHGDISRQALSLNAKGISLAYTDLTIDQDFSAFKSLREGEAGQWARERGMRRTTLGLSLTPGKNNNLGFNQSSLRDSSGSLLRQSIQLGTKGLGFTYDRRTADSGFARINNLSDAEKTELALDIRRQYNPNAAAGEVTAKDRQQLGVEAGLERSRMGFTGALGKDTSLAANMFTIDDGSGSVQRNTLSLNGRGFAVTYLDQSIGRDFSRLGQLSEFERGQLGNEVGLRRNALGIQLALNKSSSLAYNQSSARDEAGGMSRQSFAYAAKGVNAFLNVANTDASYARARDMAGLDKNAAAAIEAERGFRRIDFGANLTSIKGLQLNTYTYQATNAAEDRGRSRYRHSADWTPSKSSQISYLTEGFADTAGGATTSGVDHTRIALDQQMARGMKLHASNDTVQTTNGEQTSTVTTNYARFETDRSKANNLLAEVKRIANSAGTFENTTHLDMNLRASRAMSFRLNHLNIDRGTDPSSMTNTMAMNWQLNKQISFTGSYALTTTNNGANGFARSFSLGGELIRNLNVTGSYTEASIEGRPARSSYDLNVANAKPFSFLGLSNATMAFKYSTLNDQGRKMSQAVSGVLNANIGKNALALEYGGSLDPKNNSAVSRSFSFVSDRNEKLPFHFDLLYKARNINRGDVQLVRRYNLTMRIDRATNLAYSYQSLPEAGNGQMQPLVSSSFSLKRSLGASSSFALDYTTLHDLAKRTSVRKLGAIYQSKISSLAAVQVGYSVDISNLNGQNVNAHTVSMNFDRRINADNVLAFGAAYTMNQNGSANDVRGTVEFKTRF